VHILQEVSKTARRLCGSWRFAGEHGGANAKFQIYA